MALLAINDVTVAYDKVETVRGVSLAVEPGQIVTVIGPSGAGKTTLLEHDPSDWDQSDGWSCSSYVDSRAA